MSNPFKDSSIKFRFSFEEIFFFIIFSDIVMVRSTTFVLISSTALSFSTFILLSASAQILSASSVALDSISCFILSDEALASESMTFASNLASSVIALDLIVILSSSSFACSAF